LLNHRFIREARGTQNLVHLIKRYEGWVALGEEEEYEDQPPEHEEYAINCQSNGSPNEQWNETWDFGTIRPSYGHNTGTRRFATRSASGTVRAVNSPAQGREPLQPLPAMQRPLTPPQSQRHSPKYGGMAKNERELSSPRKDANLQIATREEIDMYDSAESDGEAVQYYDFAEEDDGVGTSTTVKMSDRMTRLQDQSLAPSTGWQDPNGPPMRSPSPARKPVAPVRSESQITTPVASRYSVSDATGVPARSSATSTTAILHTATSTSTFGVNATPRASEHKVNHQRRTYDALEDILLPALDEVFLL
jgi:hypothetical protein